MSYIGHENIKEELKKMEKDVINLSLDIVEKIINYEVNRNLETAWETTIKNYTE